VTDVSELGLALRNWRDRIGPASVGLPAGRQRRAAGLRREGKLKLLAVIGTQDMTEHRSP
jgi:hypothetical protein